MPLSKNGKLYYTREQLNFAQHEITALEYAQKNNIPLIKQGTYFKSEEHNSLIFFPNGNFYWNKYEIHGNAITFAMYYEDKSFIEAVLAVAGETNHVAETNEAIKENLSQLQNQIITDRQTTKENSTNEIKEFVLPPRAESQKRLFAYLCNERKIDNSIVSTLLSEKQIYLSDKYFNVVFVGYDENNNAKSGFQRGTISFLKEPFKRDVFGSEKKYPFVIKSETPSDTVYVFEAAIDALSHATLTKYSDTVMWREYNRLSLGGVSPASLKWYLEHNPNIKNVVLCLDNDEAGKNSTEKIGNELSESGYVVYTTLPKYKDWNEDLVNTQKSEIEENKFSLLYTNENITEPVPDTEYEI